MDAAEKKEQFIHAYNEYQDSIFKFFYFRVYNKEKAQELTQDTYIKVWKYVVDGKEITYMKAFVYKVAYHLVVDYSRKKKEKSLDALLEEGIQFADQRRPSEKDRIDWIATMQEVDKLDEKYKEIIKMRYVDGLSPKDIGNIIGSSENVVSVRLHRGLKKVKATIE
jgi:RNA polymerase sigma-70 factor, ECF subfamily